MAPVTSMRYVLTQVAGPARTASEELDPVGGLLFPPPPNSKSSALNFEVDKHQPNKVNILMLHLPCAILLSQVETCCKTYLIIVIASIGKTWKTPTTVLNS